MLQGAYPVELRYETRLRWHVRLLTRSATGEEAVRQAAARKVVIASESPLAIALFRTARWKAREGRPPDGRPEDRRPAAGAPRAFFSNSSENSVGQGPKASCTAGQRCIHTTAWPAVQLTFGPRPVRHLEELEQEVRGAPAAGPRSSGRPSGGRPSRVSQLAPHGDRGSRTQSPLKARCLRRYSTRVGLSGATSRPISP